MKKLFLLFGVLLLLPLLSLRGQSVVYPVQVNVALVAPYSLYLSDYVSGNCERLLVTLINRDVRYQSMPVRLRLTIKGNGFSVQTRPYASVSPLTLEPNLPYRLTVDDLRPYFEPRNLSAQGLGGDSFLKGKCLPEGMVEFGVEVLEYNTGKLLSRKGIGTAWLALQKPPLLNLPFNEETVSWREPLNLLFQWTPQSSGNARVEYELIVKELWDNGMAPESAFAYSPEIFRERIPSTSYLYGVQSPPLEAGHRYAWAVRVVPKDGADDDRVFENDGLSEIRSFRVGRYCPPPANIKATVERGYIRMDWEGMPQHIGYAVSYRLHGSEEWQTVNSTFPSAMLPGIRGGYTYEYRVAGFCDADIPTYNDHIGSITVPSEDTARLRNCGVLRPVDLSNQEPLEGLQDGDQFMAGDFPIHVSQVSGGNGYFTGHGYVHVPFLANAAFKVAFDNIFINTDRRMIRGVVKTVYDASEGGVTDLDDIFIGGNTGKVKEGITKTDLSAAFAIDLTNDFYFDEVTGRIEMTDENGQVIGYIETGEITVREDGNASNDGSPSSVFPVTVRDTAGNVYRMDVPPDESSPDHAPVPSGNRKKLAVTSVGGSGEALDGKKVSFDRLDSQIAEVEFSDTEGSLYAFDQWETVYGKSYWIRAQYEQIDQNYRVPAKLLPPGKSDRVKAVLKIKDPSVDPGKIVFKTEAGMEYHPESFDGKKNTWILPLVGGKENDGQTLYALYPKGDGGYYNLGKLLVVSYPEYRLKVKLVPVSEDLQGFDALRKTLQDIYGRVGIECEVEKLPVFEYDAPDLYQNESGLFSAYTPEMKALNAAYTSSHAVEEDAAYLFVLSKSGYKKDRNFSGFMPVGKQFGYLYRDDFRSSGEFATAVAHELGHGRLSLKHPFDKSLGLSEGDLPDNLMDYRNGRALAKWQWDVIHDPGVVVRIFERDKDAMIKVNLKIDRGNYNIGGHEEILSYLLNSKEDELIYNLQKYDYVDINNEEEKNRVAVLVVKNVLSGIEIGDETEAKIMVEEFINNYIIKKIALHHERMMEEIQNSETFSEVDIREKVNGLLNTLVGATTASSVIIDSYIDVWKKKFITRQCEIGFLKKWLTEEDGPLSWTKQGLQDALHYLSNNKFKDLIRAKWPSISNKELQELITAKNNRNLLKNVKISNMVESFGVNDISKINQNLDDLSLSVLAASKTTFRAEGPALKVLSKIEKLSQNGILDIVALGLNFTALSRRIEADERITPADLLGLLPIPISLFSYQLGLMIDDKMREIHEIIFETAPDWNIVKLWNQKFRGQADFPDEPLYMYYTDETDRINPNVIPTSCILPLQVAKDVFGFLPSVVNFDNKSKISKDNDKLFFLPTKQVKIIK